MTETLSQLCKTLHLGYVTGAFEEVEFKDRESFLIGVLQAELEGRQRAKLKRLLRKAAFPQLKTLGDYDFDAVTFTERCTQATLTVLTFLERRENILMLGKVGTGKTHLASALGIEACRRGHDVRFFRVADLVSILQEKHASGTLQRFQRELAKSELLILDEVGFVPFHQTGAELLFHVVSECYEQRSVIVTSNLEFGQWNTVFG